MVVPDVQSWTWAHFKADEVSFKIICHTTVLAQTSNSSVPLKILFDIEF
jgi:hypothetical protein